MEEKEFQKVLILYQIKYTKNFNDYNLIKVMSRKFGIFEYSPLIDTVRLNKYVKETINGQMSYYEINEAGNDFLSQHYEELIQTLRNEYLEKDKEYIEALISWSKEE